MSTVAKDPALLSKQDTTKPSTATTNAAGNAAAVASATNAATGKKTHVEGISLIEVASPSKVNFSNQPIRKSKKYEALDPNEFVKTKAPDMLAWIDSVVLSEELRLKFKKFEAKPQGVVISEKLIDSFMERLKKPLENLVIYRSNPRVGLGVNLGLDAGISKGTVIITYGAYMTCPTRKSEHYSADWDTPEYNAYMNQNFVVNRFRFNAEKIGNYSRFFQDAPLPEELNKVTNVTKEVKERILTANSGRGVAVVDGYPISYIFAMRDILPGEPIVWSYGDGNHDWFKTYGLRRYVMDQDGEIVGYLENNKIIFDYPERFIKDVNDSCSASIAVFAKPSPTNTPIKTCLDRLKTDFNIPPGNDGKSTHEQSFLILKSFLSDKDSSELLEKNPVLKSLRGKFERLLEEYGAGRRVEGLPIPVPSQTATAAVAARARK